MANTRNSALPDQNYNPTLTAVSSSDPTAVVVLEADPVTKRLLVSGSAATEYTEGDTDTSIAGVAIMWEDTSDTLRAVSAAKPLPVNIVAGGAGDGAILDGVSSSIKATVLDYTSSNPLAVRLTDTNGDYIAAGAGTQYTEDAAAAANPVGTALILVREDARAGSLTTTDGDNVAARGNNKGELYVKTTDSDALLTTIDADTSNISTKIDTLAGAVSGTEMQVDVLTSALPTGASTLAEQQSQTTHLATIAGDTTSIQTATELIDDVIYVDDADWTDNTSKHALIGGVYQSAPHTVTDGDVSPALMDANGRFIVAATDNGGSLTIDNAHLTSLGGAISGTEVQVDVLTSALPTGASTLAEQQSQTTHLATIAGDTTDIEAAVELIDDTVATLGTTTYTEAATKGLIVGAIRRDADTTLVDTTNEVGPLQMNAAGQLKVEVFSGETLPVSGTVTANLAAGTNNIGDVDILSIAAGDNNIGNVDIASIAAGDNNIGNVDIVSGTITTVSTLTGGGIAHDNADSGNPHKIGYKAFSPDGTTPGTAVAENDRTDAKGDLDGRLFVNDEHPRYWSYHLNTSTAQTDTSVQADPGDGFQIVITDIQFSNGAATAINMFLEEGASTIWGPVYLEAINGRGYVWKGKKHVTASTALTLTTSSSTAHSVEILGYIQAV